MAKIPEKILLVSTSGRGKTYSFRNLDPKTTGFINVEYKTLPFKDSFANHDLPKTWQDAYNTLLSYAQNPAIETVCLDSLSAYLDLILLNARETKRGFDVWSFYNEQVGKLLTLIKRYPKTLFITAHYEWVNEEGLGTTERRVKSKGGEWKGTIEREFTIVLYGDVKINPLDKSKKEYVFVLQNDGTNSAKCPPYIFGEEVLEIPNDCQLILDQINKL